MTQLTIRDKVLSRFPSGKRVVTEGEEASAFQVFLDKAKRQQDNAYRLLHEKCVFEGKEYGGLYELQNALAERSAKEPQLLKTFAFVNAIKVTNEKVKKSEETYAKDVVQVAKDMVKTTSAVSQAGLILSDNASSHLAKQAGFDLSRKLRRRMAVLGLSTDDLCPDLDPDGNIMVVTQEGVHRLEEYLKWDTVLGGAFADNIKRIEG